MEYGTYQPESPMASAGAPRPQLGICPNVADRGWSIGSVAKPGHIGTHTGFAATTRRPKEDSS